MRKLSRDDVSPNDTKQDDLTKVAYSLLGIYLASWLFSHLEDILAYRYVTHLSLSALNRYFRLVELAYTTRGSFVFLEMLILIWLFRPVSLLFKHRSKPPGNHALFYDVIAGVGGGIGGFAIAIPVLASRAASLFGGITTSRYPAELLTILVALLFGFLLPIGTELVFRAIVQRRFLAHMNVAAAIVVSSVLSAKLWSLFNLPSSMILGVACGVLYWWRGSLLPAVIADIVMTLSSCAYLGLHG